MNLSTKWKRRLANASLLLGSTVLCLLGAEVGTRIFLGHSVVLYPRYFTAAHYSDVTLRRLLPNSIFWHTSIDGSWQFRTNAQGFRDDENYAYDKPIDSLRILILGDSHTQGYEVRQSFTFAKVLEQRLRKKGLDVQVLNTGISGFGTAEELMFLQHEGMKYRPNAVVLAFCENDFDDSVKSGLYGLQDGKLVVRNTQHTPGVRAIAFMNAVPGASWLSQNSYFFSLLINNVWDLTKKALSLTAREQVRTEYAIRVSDVDHYERELVAALLGKMKEVVHAANIPFIIVEIPSTDPSGRGAWQSSIPADFVPVLISAADVYIPADSYLAGAQKGTVHVPHGHRHISEQTHARIAELLDRILSRIDRPTGDVSGADKARH